MSSFFQEVSQAIRSLLHYPQLTGMAVLMLALGIGATTAIYCVLNATLLSPPEYNEPEQLVALWGVLPARDVDEWPAAPTDVEMLRTQTSQFADVAAAFGNNHVFKLPSSEPEQVISVGMTWNLFSLLGVDPVLGRNFNQRDAAFNPNDVPLGARPPADTFNPSNTVILSHAFWRDRFGSDESIIGRLIYLDELPVTVVGVMPAGFQLLMHGQVPATPDMFEVLRVDLANNPGTNVFLNVIGRLKDTVTIEQAQAEIDALTARVVESDPIYQNTGFHNRLIPLQQELTKDVQAIIWTLVGAVVFILLIACANVANLLLVRATSMQRDTAIRAALGCSRKRLMQRCLLESLLLAVTGSVLGVILAIAVLPALVALQPQNLPQLNTIAINLEVLAVILLIVFSSTLLAGMIPALLVSNKNFTGLKDRSAQQENRSSGRWRNGLVIAEVALSFVLLIGAGLMIRSFSELIASDPGFSTENRLSFNYALPNARYPDPTDNLQFHEAFKRQLEQLPGVQEVGGIFPLPLSGAQFGSRYAAERSRFTDGTARQAQYRFVYPGYFEAVDTRLLAGRFISQADQDSGLPYAVVNEALAQRAWPDESALGKTLYIRGATPEPRELEVVGVIAHQKQATLDEEPTEVLYASNRFGADLGFGAFTNWVVHGSGDINALIAPIRQQLSQLDAEVPLVQVNTLNELVRQTTGPTRFAMTLISIFGMLALILACIGLYGVLAYRVRQKMPEIGVRFTFGANPNSIFTLVVRQGMVLVGLGLMVGVIAALGLSRLLMSLLVGVSPADPLTFAVIIMVFAVIAFIACSMPALRAMRVDPAVILRAE